MTVYVESVRDFVSRKVREMCVSEVSFYYHMHVYCTLMYIIMLCITYQESGLGFQLLSAVSPSAALGLRAGTGWWTASETLHRRRWSCKVSFQKVRQQRTLLATIAYRLRYCLVYVRCMGEGILLGLWRFLSRSMCKCLFTSVFVCCSCDTPIRKCKLT